jgi:hypothetical protein
MQYPHHTPVVKKLKGIVQYETGREQSTNIITILATIIRVSFNLIMNEVTIEREIS